MVHIWSGLGGRREKVESLPRWAAEFEILQTVLQNVEKIAAENCGSLVIKHPF